MAVSLRSSSSAGDTASSITVDEPTGAAVGDWLIACVAGNGIRTLSDGNGSTPFTKTHQHDVANAVSAVFVRKKEAGDPATLTFNISASDRISCVAMAFQDGDATTAYDVAPSASNDASGTSINTLDCADITTLTDNAIHVCFAHLDSSSQYFNSVPAGYTEVQILDAGDPGQGIAVHILTIGTAGATGAQTYATSGAGTNLRDSFAIKDGAVATATYPYRVHKHKKGGMNVLLTM